MPRSYLITEVGSSTTKAVFIGEKDREFGLLGLGEAPTTVELPYEDVTCGIINAVRDLESKTRRKRQSASFVPASPRLAPATRGKKGRSLGKEDSGSEERNAVCAQPQ